MKTPKLLTFLAAAVFSTGIISAADSVPAGYPLQKCVVSGESLGEMGKPVKVSNEGTDVYLCCKSCTKKFTAEAAKFTAMVKAAEKK